MPLYRMFFAAMGGQCEIQLDAPTEDVAGRVANLGIAEVKRIEAKYSRFLPDSFIGQVNANAGGAAFIPCDAETEELLNYADTLYANSKGLFDITSGVLRKAWNFKTARIPSDAELEALLPLIDWPRVERSQSGLRLPTPGMEIDLGGFGKEYAADRAATILQRNGIRHAFVNLGGDIRAIGPQPSGKPWVAGIRHPRKEDEIVATIPLVDCGLATSGDYERYIEVDGQRYCHVLNPRSGRPVRYWQSISVVAPVAIAAGSYSTIAMLLEDAGYDFLQKAGVSNLCINQNGKCYAET